MHWIVFRLSGNDDNAIIVSKELNPTGRFSKWNLKKNIPVFFKINKCDYQDFEQVT